MELGEDLEKAGGSSDSHRAMREKLGVKYK